MKGRMKEFHNNLKEFFHPTWRKLLIVFIFSTLFVLISITLNHVSNWLLEGLMTSVFIVLNPFWLLLIDNTSSTPYPILSAVFNLVLLVVFPVYWYVIASLIDKSLDGNGEKREGRITGSSSGEEEYVKLGTNSNYENY